MPTSNLQAPKNVGNGTPVEYSLSYLARAEWGRSSTIRLMTSSKAACAVLILVLALAAAPAEAHLFNVDVPAPDGTMLATDVYFPFGGGTWPVVLIRTPYDKNGLATVCITLNLLGLACVAQDMRGLHASGGDNDSVFREDGPDGRATIDWIADQSWCNGSIGTWGGSALGITQYMLAPGAADELKCIMPAAATPDIYHHGFFQGGCICENAPLLRIDLPAFSAAVRFA